MHDGGRPRRVSSTEMTVPQDSQPQSAQSGRSVSAKRGQHDDARLRRSATLIILRPPSPPAPRRCLGQTNSRGGHSHVSDNKKAGRKQV